MAKAPVRSLNTKEYDELVSFLRELRQECGVSQEQLGKLLDQSDTYVYKVETKDRRLDIVELVLIAEALNLAPDLVLKRFIDRIRPRRADQ